MTTVAGSTSLQLQVLYQGAAAAEVPEDATIELCLTNATAIPLTDWTIRLGGQEVKSGARLAAGSSWSVSYRLEDWAGDIELVATGKLADTTAITATQITVVPQKLSLDDVLFIKTERLPSLLARLNAPNAVRLHYADRETLPDFYDFYSLEYSLEKLLNFSATLFERDDLHERLLARLDYDTPPTIESGRGVIRGRPNWPATVNTWLNRPEQMGIEHSWSVSPKNFATPPNLLLVYFHAALAAEYDKLARLLTSGAVRKRESWRKLCHTRARQHQTAWDNPYLAPVQAELERRQVRPQDWPQLATACERTINPAYQELFMLWQSYASRYVSLPNDEADASRLTLPPTSKLYELWATCEVAVALDLSFCGQGGLIGGTAEFAGTLNNQAIRLFYNRGVKGGWYSATRPGRARPDLRLENLDTGCTIFLDVKYRGQGPRANPDDMYKMLAYMHDFDLNLGGIIYPGSAKLSGENYVLIGNDSGQSLLEISLRPASVAALSKLKEIVTKDER